MQVTALLPHLTFADALALARSHPRHRDLDEAELRGAWNRGQDALARRQPRWNGPVVREFPINQYTTEMQQIPQTAFLGSRPWRFAVVDLTRVVGFQQYITESRVTVPPEVTEGDQGALLRFTIQRPGTHNVAVGQSPNHQFSLSSRDINLRVVADAQADTPQGKVFGFVIGHGIPWMQVVSLNGRQYLRDGYHRAVGLLRKGIDQVPVALIETSDPADLGLRPGFFSLEKIAGDVPPLLTDFLDGELAIPTELVSHTKVIYITAAEFAIPADEDL